MLIEPIKYLPTLVADSTSGNSSKRIGARAGLVKVLFVDAVLSFFVFS